MRAYIAEAYYSGFAVPLSAGATAIGRQVSILPLKRVATIVVLSALLLPSAFARKVKTIAGPQENFVSYKTYRWLSVRSLSKTGIVEDDPEIAPVIRSAVNRELARVGLTEATGEVDLEISTFASVTWIPQLEGSIGGGIWFQFPEPIAMMGRYNKQGAIAVNLIDTKTKKSAWAGIASDHIDDRKGSGLGKIPGAVSALFRKYPARK